MIQHRLAWLTGIALVAGSAFAQPAVPPGTPIDEAYRKKFTTCDQTDSFDGVQFPIRNNAGKIVWFGCKGDPSRFERFEKIDASGARPAAIIIQSKLAHDEDGSTKACSSSKGPTDQCTTTLMLNPTDKTKCIVHTASGKKCVPVSADTIPYVVMPAAAPKGRDIDGNEFAALSGLRVGDYGVVIANGKVVPVIIADTGPAYKIGEGSTALLKGLSDGNARTFAKGVVFVLFPNTHDDPATLSPDTLKDVVAKKGAALFAALTAKP